MRYLVLLLIFAGSAASGATLDTDDLTAVESLVSTYVGEVGSSVGDVYQLIQEQQATIDEQQATMETMQAQLTELGLAQVQALYWILGAFIAGVCLRDLRFW